MKSAGTLAPLRKVFAALSESTVSETSTAVILLPGRMAGFGGVISRSPPRMLTAVADPCPMVTGIDRTVVTLLTTEEVSTWKVIEN